MLNAWCNAISLWQSAPKQRCGSTCRQRTGSQRTSGRKSWRRSVVKIRASICLFQLKPFFLYICNVMRERRDQLFVKMFVWRRTKTASTRPASCWWPPSWAGVSRETSVTACGRSPPSWPRPARGRTGRRRRTWPSGRPGITRRWSTLCLFSTHLECIRVWRVSLLGIMCRLEKRDKERLRQKKIQSATKKSRRVDFDWRTVSTSKDWIVNNYM